MTITPMFLFKCALAVFVGWYIVPLVLLGLAGVAVVTLALLTK